MEQYIFTGWEWQGKICLNIKLDGNPSFGRPIQNLIRTHVRRERAHMNSATEKWYICIFGRQRQATKWNFIPNLHFAFLLWPPLPGLIACTCSRRIGQVISSVVVALLNTKRAHFTFQSNTTAAHWCHRKKNVAIFQQKKQKKLSRYGWMFGFQHANRLLLLFMVEKNHRNSEHSMYPTAIKLNHPK